MADIQDDRLGRFQRYPKTTLGGRPYDVRNAPATTGLSDGYFVVLDPFPVPGMDVAEELRQLEMLISPPQATSEPDVARAVVVPEEGHVSVIDAEPEPPSGDDT